MAKSPSGRPGAKAVRALCVTALLAGSFTAPAISGTGSAVAAETCASSVATYVKEVKPGLGFIIVGGTTTLRKYVDWDPLGGGAGGPIFATDFSATVDAMSQFFGGGNGIIYEITSLGTLKSYKDNTATGGSLLTPVKTYGAGWDAFYKVWAYQGRIYAISGDGKLTVYEQSDPTTGGGTITVLGTVAADHAAVKELAAADDVWAVDGKLYALTGGKIKYWIYAERADGTPTVKTTPIVAATGLTSAVQAWSPGPGTVYTSDGSNSYSGTIAGYTTPIGAAASSLDTRITVDPDPGAPLVRSNPEVRTGIFGTIFADTAPCLYPMEEGQPYFGTRPADDNPAAAGPQPAPAMEPAGTKTFRGRFVRGDGQPAAGLSVVVEAADLTNEDGSSTDLPNLGTTTTAADGSWSLPLPDPLPAAVQAAADANGGAVNAVATVTGVTSNGTIMQGTDHLTAAPDTASASMRSLVASTAADGAHTIEMLPQLADITIAEPTNDQYAGSWASKQEGSTVDLTGDDTLPTWQNESSAPPSNFNPYVINGTDTSSMTVTPYLAGCERWETILDRRIYYTDVVEGHAYWDAKATVDYDQKLASNVEVAVSSGSNWKISGSVNVGSTIGTSTGYTTRGPYFAKEWRVPIEYKKVKKYTKCGGTTVSHKEIIAGRYKIPSGGATGTYGQDKSYKDGSSYWSSPTANRAYVQPGAYFQISKGRSIKWSAAATAYGIALGASTQYDGEHKQRITAGSKTSYRHYIWGKNGPLWDNPGVFYSY